MNKVHDFAASPQSSNVVFNGRPTVSVIIPNYNHGDVLPRAVRAHQSQTLKPAEIIIVDDGSTDDSLSVAEALERDDATVRLIRHSDNRGPNAGINTGLAVSTGQFVTFSAADDVVDPPFLERSIAALQAHPAAAFSFLDPSRLYVDRNWVERVPLALAPKTRYFSPDAFEALFVRNSFTITPNTVVYRREAITSIGGFRVDLEWQADWMANFLLAFRHGAVYIPDTLAHSVFNPNSYGESGMRQRAGQHRLTDSCIAALFNDYPDVVERFQRAALLPEMRMRSLFWLVGSSEGRRYLSARIAWRLFQREIWRLARPLTPLTLRRWMRRHFAGPSAAERRQEDS